MYKRAAQKEIRAKIDWYDREIFVIEIEYRRKIYKK